jgi:glycosyltransferase involved in cell wall biosynthesis
MRVSVICPVFDTRVDLLEAAVASVLAQHGDALHELILADDGSTRGATLLALGRLKAMDGRIVVLDHARNTGPAAARNRGLAHATGDWIGFIDSDDLWPADKLTQACAVLDQAPAAEWIGCGTEQLGIDGALRPCPELSCAEQTTPRAGRPARLEGPALTRCLILEWMHLGAHLIRRETVQAAGGFDSAIAYGEDWNLLCVISRRATLHFTPAIGYVLRRQFASLMWSAGRMSDRYASGHRAALRDPRLHCIRREARWALYRTYKEIALQNAANGRPWHGLWFSLRALAVDPRELGEFAVFLRILLRRQVARPSTYSNAEILDLAGIPP